MHLSGDFCNGYFYSGLVGKYISPNILDNGNQKLL